MVKRRMMFFLVLAGALTLPAAAPNAMAGSGSGAPPVDGGDDSSAPPKGSRGGSVREPTGMRAPVRPTPTRRSSEAPADRPRDTEDDESLREDSLYGNDDADAHSSRTSPEDAGDEVDDESDDPYEDDGMDAE